MNRNEKKDVVSVMRQRFETSCLVVVVRQVGLTVSEVTDLRRKMKDAKADFKVVKNTLLKLAVEETRLSGLSPLFKGPTALGMSADPITAAKIIVNFAKDNAKITILGGFLDGRVIDQASIKALATLPSLDELRSKIIALILAPATKLAILTKEPAARIARVLAAREV